jgi:hypothetical protein
MTGIRSPLARSGLPDFFAKRWTAYELDGLVKLHVGSPEQVAGSERPSRVTPSDSYHQDQRKSALDRTTKRPSLLLGKKR